MNGKDCPGVAGLWHPSCSAPFYLIFFCLHLGINVPSTNKLNKQETEKN
jgi:hypothetical protein